jgi:hypothetical protein
MIEIQNFILIVLLMIIIDTMMVLTCGYTPFVGKCILLCFYVGIFGISLAVILDDCNNSNQHKSGGGFWEDLKNKIRGHKINKNPIEGPNESPLVYKKEDIPLVYKKEDIDNAPPYKAEEHRPEGVQSVEEQKKRMLDFINSEERREQREQREQVYLTECELKVKAEKPDVWCAEEKRKLDEKCKNAKDQDNCQENEYNILNKFCNPDQPAMPKHMYIEVG